MTSHGSHSFALLGSGQFARHFQHYLQLLEAPVRSWSRNGDPRFNSFTAESASVRLVKTAGEATHILLAVRDDAIAGLAALMPPGRTLVHFSGAVNVPGVHAAHPLMTFTGKLENKEWYEAIPFVTDRGCEMHDILPGLKNPSYPLEPEHRPLYHALSSLAGNAPFLLWNKIGAEFEKSLGLQREILEPFLKQAVTNALNSRNVQFAGPIARGDWSTVKSHIESLAKADPRLLNAYRSYLNLATDSGAPVPEVLL